MLKKTIFAASVLAMVLVSCDKGGNSTTTEGGESLSGVAVSAESYSTADGSEGYRIEFRAGDRIGLFAVKDGAVSSEINNLCLEAAVQGDGIVWKSFVEELSLPADAAVYAYWPYIESASESVDASAEDADGFFAPLTRSWETVKDQSDFETFSNASLMTGSGTVSGDMLSLDLRPYTQLIVFRFPGKIYRFTNTDYVLSDYTPAPVKTECLGFTPYSEDAKRYLIVNPAVPDSLRGVYVDGGEEKDWAFGYGFEPTHENCLICTVGEGSEIIEHNLQVGDFFLEDGSILSKDADMMDVLSEHVLGVVYQLNPDRISESIKEALGGNAHALVISARNSVESSGEVTGQFRRWYFDYDALSCYRDETEIGLPAIQADNYLDSFLAADADIDGYTNTHLILTERAADIEGLYPTFKAIAGFAEETGGPAEGTVTTGWFLPSYGQLLDAFRAFSGLPLDEEADFYEWGNEWFWTPSGAGDFAEILNNVFSKVEPSQRTDVATGRNFWTSTPATSSTVCNIGFSTDYLDCIFELKENGSFVRPVLAF